MTQKRISTFIIALFWVFTTLAGCQQDGEKDVSSRTETSTHEPGETETQGADNAAIDDMVPADSSRTGYITSKEAFVETIGKLVDLTLYEDLSEYDSGSFVSYAYNLKYEHEKEFALDYTIKLSDGTKIIMPISLPDLAEKGWKLQDSSQSETEVESGYMTFGICENAAGKTIRLSAYNPTEDKLPFGECTVCEIELNMFSTFERTNAISSTPGFVICEEITHQSTLEDIVSVLGAPTSFFVSLHKNENGEYEYSSLDIEYSQPKNAYDYLRISMSGDGNYIMTLEYAHLVQE